jgi:hypothetical protein
MSETISRVMKGTARLESQLKLYKIVSVQTVVYANGSWIVGENHDTRLQTSEMKFLCVAAGYTCTDQQI